MPLRAALPLAILASILFVIWQAVPWAWLLHWTLGVQREFQNAMASGLRAAQAAEPAAVASLCTATALYGVVHAAGPGHGKVLLGGAALASGATLRRMAALTLASSLAQAGVAIALAGALALALQMAARQMGQVADAWLAPASQLAIAAVGALLVARGVRMLRTRPAARHDHRHDHEDGAAPCGCGHAHGPSAERAASLAGWRDAAVLVASIAIRPCTGALFLLAIALRLDIFWVGALAVAAMGLGTAAFNLVVAASGVMARRLAILGASGARELQAFSAGAHMLGGGLIMAASLVWLTRLMP